MISENSLWQFNDDESLLIFKDSTDILNDYKEFFSSQFPNLSLEPNTPQMNLIAYLTEIDSVTIKNFSEFVNSFFNGGSGKILDMQMWNLFRAERKKAVYGYVTIKATGKVGGRIPKGFIVSDGTQQFKTEQEYFIGDNGEVEFLAVATEINENIALANTITTQITPEFVVETITNPNSSVAGIPQETDTDFYKRCITYNSLYKNSSFRALMANISQVQGVSKLNGYENPTSNEVVYKNETFTPHSFGVVCIGGDDREIADMIRQCKSLGSFSQGTTEIIFDDTEFQTQSVFRFYRPANTPLKFSVKARLYRQSPNAYEQIIKDGLKLFVDNLQIGDYFTQPQVSQELSEYCKGYFDISDLKIALKSGTLGYNPISLTFLQNATIAENDINITYEIA